MIEILNQINDALWGYLIIGALIGCGLWFTWRTRFVQFRMVGEMLRLLTDSSVKPQGAEKHISSFQAFAVSLASRVGTGNLAGVATAIAVGGPGAVFWMWVMALVGSATAFVESTLGQLFKQPHKDSFIGGPAYYIQRGLHCRWMAVLFAILITVTFGLANNSVQALGVFTDTLVVCSCTAFIILTSGLYTSPELNGIMLTQAALESEVGSWGPTFIAIAIFLFAYSSVIGNYYYGEANVRFMTKSRSAMTSYRLLSGGVMVLFGALTTLEVVWSMIDLCMALLTACNLVAIVLLGKYVFRLLDDYRSQKRQGIKEPTFHRSQLPEIEIDLECWED
jgi:Na+/alanine symporter